MKKFILIPLILMTTILSAQKAPTTKKESVKDKYFGKEISDPYRWLEDDNSAETAEWVKLQNQVTNDYLNKLPQKSKVLRSLVNMWNYTKYSSPSKQGEYYIHSKNDGLQNQSVIYIQKGLKGEETEFINPNTLSDDGTSSLGSVVFSKNQKLCAYSVSAAGSDWQDIHVMDVATKTKMKDVINYSKFSSISWKGDEGFYYSGYDKPDEKKKFSNATEFQKIFFHKIGTPQSQDILIYEDKQNPQIYKGAALSENEQWLMLSLSKGTDGNQLMYFDLKNGAQQEFLVLSKGYEVNQDFIENVDGKFLVYTNHSAPNYKLVLIDPQNAGVNQWKTIIPEKENKLDAVHLVGNKLFCSYLVNACSKIDRYDMNGAFETTINLPGFGTVTGFEGGAKDNHTFYTYTSYNVPPTLYKYDIATGKSDIFKKPTTNTDFENTTIVEQMWFTSKDGTKVPMFVYHRKDIDINKGPYPVFLYGYGGFNISLTPSFSIPMSYFVQKGGVYVSVSLRGGSEFGEKWHKAGMLEKKQNVFDDFIGAAEHLINKGITTKDKLAIHGRSNGGLLVGACMTQRPDLFKVALPGVGVLDMLRYHKFTVGWGWAVEYGSSDKEKDFNYLLKYSPLHNVKKGTSYPATMITTADHDDRVVPAHSFKFAAELQEKHVGTNPILIRIDTQAGHGAGKPTSKQIEEWGDVMTFVLHHLNMEVTADARK